MPRALEPRLAGTGDHIKHFLWKKPRGVRAGGAAGQERPWQASEPLRVSKAAQVPSGPSGARKRLTCPVLRKGGPMGAAGGAASPG